MTERNEALAALAWLAEIGADEALEEEPQDRFAAPSKPAAREAMPAATPAIAGGRHELPAPPRAGRPESAPPLWEPQRRPPQPLDLAVAEARRLAEGAADLAALAAALETFDGCPLKATARRTVIARGTPESRIMLLGEAPGAEEDREGRPFVGRAGKLLDAMLAAIGLDERTVYISNMIFWRPPGNRTPEPQEIATCLPFVERHIALVRPRFLMLLGAVATRGLLGRTQGITQDRGRWFDYQTPALPHPVPALATFHPSYLLRRPAHKRLAWRDLLAFKAAMEGRP